jgi:hypothetical protein
MSSSPGAGPMAATGKADHHNGGESHRRPHPNQDPLAPRALPHSRKQRSRQSGELGPRWKRPYSDRMAIPLHLESGWINLRGKITRYGGVGGRHVPQALQLQIQGQGGDKETYPDDKHRGTGCQVLPTTVWARTHGSLRKMVRPLT